MGREVSWLCVVMGWWGRVLWCGGVLRWATTTRYICILLAPSQSRLSREGGGLVGWCGVGCGARVLGWSAG